MRRVWAGRRGLTGVVTCALLVILPAPAPAQSVAGGSAAKTAARAQAGSGAQATSFVSTLADVRAQQGEATPPTASPAEASSVSAGTTNFAVLPAAAAYTRLDSIQTA